MFGRSACRFGSAGNQIHARIDSAEPPLQLSSQSPTVIAPPFSDDGLALIASSINAMNGRLDPSEGFAIDWIKVDRQGKAFRTDGKKPDD